MIHSYHTINNNRTHLITWGDPFDCGGKDVIICITGNPGLPDFYDDFGAALHYNTKLPVCIIGHSGHDVIPHEGSSIPKVNEHLFNLKDQLQHKLDFVNSCIDSKSKFHIIGHSIGAWLLIEMCCSNPELISRILSVNLLFPTLQRMAETKNGFVLNKLVRNLHSLLLFFVTLFCLLPESTRTFLINLYLKFYSITNHHANTIRKFIHVDILKQVLFLAYDEMDYVQDLNTEGIDKIKKFTHIIYSSIDGWVPLLYIEDFKRFQPELQLKEVNIEHSFILKSSETVAEMVSNNILNTKNK